MSKPVCNDVISFDTKAWSGWLFKSLAKVCGRRGVPILCWLIGVGLSAIGAGPLWVAFLALVTHMEVWVSCATKIISLLIKNAANFVVRDDFVVTGWWKLLLVLRGGKLMLGKNVPCDHHHCIQ